MDEVTHEQADGTDVANRIGDVERVRAVLVAAARAGTALTYSEMLAELGLRFSRPRMRALCRTMEQIDEDGRAAGEPGLAVLVVRASDGLPGQGWWTGGRALMLGHVGDWTGPAAQALVTAEQRAAFDWWSAGDA
ncbi:ribose-phosphate pyrophosphokinase [Sphingomonas montana]|uniref:ribose-phosphate pyrophosphokinase n=1 Tax=Sphingomonas montana TaxID=1843236 RepID=UPI00096BE67C|nr:ribose-phosphate pyrophosphokinase [Sphingomonas montana]